MSGAATRAVERVGKWLTIGKVAALAIALVTGAVGTGVGWLLGEGAARATYDGRIVDHDKRIGVLEIRADRAAETSAQILGKLGNVEGTLETIRGMMAVIVERKP
jgi:hypothetical protein